MKTCSEAIAKLVRVCVCVSGGSLSIMRKTHDQWVFPHSCMVKNANQSIIFLMCLDQE